MHSAPTQLSFFPGSPAEAGSKLSEATQLFLDHCRVAKSLSAHTLRAYRGDLTLFVACVSTAASPSEISRDAIREYVRFLRDDRRLRETSIKRRLATLKIFFGWLEHESAIAISPFHRLNLTIRLPRRLPRALDAVDMRRLLRTAARGGKRPRAHFEDALMHLAVLILFSTGLRVSELVSIRLADVAVKDGAILVRGKGNRERRVYLCGREAAAALRRFIAERNRRHGGEHLFVTDEGTPVSTQFIRSRLRSIARRGAISRRVTPHMLRHTAATQLLDAGVDIRFVQKLLGHSSIATTQIYTHVTDSMLKATLSRANTLGRVKRAV